MKVLLVVPEIRLNDKPFEFPFWSGILASIVENKGGDVAILDLNALRMNYGGGNVPTDVIKEEHTPKATNLKITSDPRIIRTPHVGGTAISAQEKAYKRVIEKLN